MSALTSREPLRPGKKGVARLIERAVFGAMPYVFAFLRRWKPVAKAAGWC